MKPVAPTAFEKALLKRRSLIETVFDELKDLCQIEHTHHRSLGNFLVNLMADIVAYCLSENKPSLSFLLTARHDKKAALRFFKKAIGQHGFPQKVMIDKSGANAAALEALNEETGAEIEVRQIKYLNNLVEQDHRAVKRIAKPMLGFKSFNAARRTLAGVELMHMIKKGQMVAAGGQKLSAAAQFYSLAA